MKLACYTICMISVLLLCQACNKTDVYAQKAKSLDSLGGAINSMVKELKRIDTVVLNKAINRFNYYDRFIQQNVNDTVAKPNADALLRFYASGKTLRNFSANSRVLIRRAVLITTQLSKLSQDIKNETLDEAQSLKFFEIEKTEAAGLIEAGYIQQKSFYTGIEEFKNALPGVEQLIKSHNNGELPTIIKDTVNL